MEILVSLLLAAVTSVALFSAGLAFSYHETSTSKMTKTILKNIFLVIFVLLFFFFHFLGPSELLVEYSK